MTSQRATLLLTSVGSGVTRGVLQALAGRRGELNILGSDVDPAVPEVQQCDGFVKLPRVDDPAFVDCVAEACEGVDLVIPGTDTDVVALAAAANDPASPIRMACAPFDMVRMTRDKHATARWCADRGIPFAPTVSTDGPGAAAQASRLVADHGYPLIAKPRAGSASLGVLVVLNQAQLDQALQRPGLILQPFLGPPPGPLTPDLSAGVPLFWEIPCPDEPGIMALIGPVGDVGPTLSFTSAHRLGRNEELRLPAPPGLGEFAEDVVERFAGFGWRGPLNLQVRPSPDGWQIIEINARFTGGTAGRLHLGLDEVGWVVNRWLGRPIVPPWPYPPVSRVPLRLTEVPLR